ncbi:MAG: TraR/DksA family transcriptional regulator [Bdellovibrionales bacterium]|jgi:DnaK suppressor protein|nr:TraR/DksA family transcriptional regulator [Bdellovibrionales bacterium]
MGTKLKKTELKKLTNKLLSEKERLTLNDKPLDNFILDKNELSDTVDEASVNIQAHQALRFRTRELLYLRKITQSLQKVEEGTYGSCKDCDDPISYERLMARPTANLCINCKTEAELEERGNIFHSKSKSIGQTLQERMKVVSRA